MTKTASTWSKVQENDDGYPQLEKLIAARAAQPGPFFTTDTEPMFAEGSLYDVFLVHLPEDRRQR